jgi:hypothetical protein
MKTRTLAIVAAGAALLLTAARLEAYNETHYGHDARWRASLRPWHGRFYNVEYGAPVALVVPPTAELQTDYGWGVCSKRTTRINHQFQRPWPDGRWTPYGFLPAAEYPSDTRQHGVYYIRGPW